VLQAQQLFGSFFYEELDGIFVAEPVAAGDGVIGMIVEGVARLDDASGPSLGRVFS